MVTPDVVAEMSQNLTKFSLKQVMELKINPEDMYMSFPYEVGIIIPEGRYLFSFPNQQNVINYE